MAQAHVVQWVLALRSLALFSISVRLLVRLLLLLLEIVIIRARLDLLVG